MQNIERNGHEMYANCLQVYKFSSSCELKSASNFLERFRFEKRPTAGEFVLGLSTCYSGKLLYDIFFFHEMQLR